MADHSAGADEINLGDAASLPLERPTLRKADGRRFVCVKRADEVVDVLDDRCPHEGYPLSQGTVQGGVLTCHWHNWKFETATGRCAFGGEDARRYPCRVDGGQLLVDLRIDPAVERRRLRASLARALVDGSLGAATREGLRLAALDGAVDGGLSVIAEDAALRAEYGFDHGLALLADVVRWVDDGLVPPSDALAAAIGWVGEPMVRFAPRERPAPTVGDPSDVVDALDAERRDDAEAIARHLARCGREGELVDALLPWLARDLTDYGHGLIYVLKATELAARLGCAEPIVGALIHQLSWATRDSALPGWRATHEGVREAPAGGDGDVDDAYVEEVLASEKRAVRGCLERLHGGASPRALLTASARAAAIRLARFDPAWERRDDAPVTVLGVSHALTFADAALGLIARMPAPLAARFAVQSAGFVGQLARADGEAPEAASEGALLSALATRDVTAALAAIDDDGFYEALAPFALQHAFVRPIFAAHAIKTTEACRRLEALAPPWSRDFRRAAVCLSVPRRPERFFTRAATVAARFLEDGRPPPGLY